MKKYLFYFAVTGWALGLLVHILSVSDIDVTEKIPFIWLLHFGIFIVMLPVVLDFKNNTELQEYQQSGMTNKMNPTALFKILFKDTPTWMAILVIGSFFYAFINFALFAMSQEGSPEIRDGLYILHNHGKLIRTLTEQEYHHFRANEIRGFSGHWILFYGLATSLLFKFSGLTKKTEMI